MKLLLLVMGILLSLSATAQPLEPGGGQLDPTKKYKKINLKKVEPVFSKNIKKNWQRCGFNTKEVPDSFISFYKQFKNEKHTIDPKDLIKPSKAACPECLQDKIEKHESGNFLCLIHNEEFQQILHVLSKQSKQFNLYLGEKIIKEDFTAADVTEFYNKFAIDYE